MNIPPEPEVPAPAPAPSPHPNSVMEDDPYWTQSKVGTKDQYKLKSPCFIDPLIGSHFKQSHVFPNRYVDEINDGQFHNCQS